MLEKDHTTQNFDEDHHQRSIQLFTFLKHFLKLRSKVVTSYEQYEKILWLEELLQPKQTVSLFQLPKEKISQGIWFKIDKPTSSSPPAIPQQLFPWVEPNELSDASLSAPTLRERVPAPGLRLHGEPLQKGEYRELADVWEEIKPLWKIYLEKHWKPWAEQEKQKYQQLKGYSDLFSLYLRQQKLGEAYEVICALGLLQWQKESQSIRRHLITLPLSLSFDPGTSQISVRLMTDSPGFQLETEMLESIDLPEKEIIIETHKKLQALEDPQVWESEIKSILREWSREMPLRVRFREEQRAQNASGDQAEIIFAPALILRKRSDQPLLQMTEQIIEQLKTRRSSPSLVQFFAGDTTSAIPIENARSADAGEVFFPLPFNEEQLTVLEKFRTSPGMLVKGPPGTGKSHTIANLICHFLAEGQRVLVTSQTARALKVLRNKIPEPFRALATVLLGSDSQGENDVQQSVGAIYDRLQQWDVERSDRIIQHLRTRLEEKRYQEGQVFKKLAELREQETYEHLMIAGSYSGTLQNIARELQQQEDQFRWMIDRPEYQKDPPFSDEEAVELLHLLRTIPEAEAQRFTQVQLETSQLPAPEVVQQYFEAESEAKKQLRLSLEELQQIGLTNLPELPSPLITSLMNQVNQVIQKYELLDQSSYSWLRKAASDVLSGRIKVWEALQSVTRKNLTYLKEHFHKVADWQVSGLRGRNIKTVQEHALRLQNIFIQKGKLPPAPFRGKRLRETLYIVQSISINGVLCDNSARIQQLLDYLEVAERLQNLALHWSHHLEISSKTPMAIQFAEYESLEAPLSQVLELHGEFEQLIKTLEQHRDIEITGLQNISALRKLSKILFTGQQRLQLLQSSEAIGALEEQVRQLQQANASLPELTTIANALKYRDLPAYQEAWQTFNRRMDIKATCQRRQQLWGALQETAPELARELKGSYEDSIWDKRFEHFSAAWDWARAERWLQDHAVAEKRELQEVQIKELKQSIQTIRNQLGEALAWHHCFARMTDEEREHLLAWKKAMDRYGKGTGKLAGQYWREAREHLRKSYAAIPAWVMPLYQVAEHLQPSREMFDVVIIDEASQSGPEALLLTYLAKRMIVVGDDQQISPDYVGVRKELVEQLRHKYLPQIPHYDAIGIEHSFFDLAEIRFSQQVSLREHFRCMPEIIHFSNMLCYPSQPLIPLRQFGYSRLTPTVTTRLVEQHQNGASRHKGINIDEIEALVKQVKRCCQDERYQGKSMGIISLQGLAQARAIEKLLVKELGPEEIEQRNLLCGDPYSFQGDERDVIFLSMVTAPGQKRRVLNRANDRRRFNVAVSRARDQVWLFHSVHLEELNPKCLRHRLLDYFLEPELPPEEIYEVDIRTLTRLAGQKQRYNTTPPHPFENWFEVDVFLYLREKGVPVSPQFQVDTYFIDLVIESERGKIAIECEGDQWDGPEYFAKVWAKLQMLERCGWTVIRVRGSEFYRNRERALEPIFRELDFSFRKDRDWAIVTSEREIRGYGVKPGIN